MLNCSNEIVSSNIVLFYLFNFGKICLPVSQAFINLSDYGAILGSLDQYLHLSNKHVLKINLLDLDSVEFGKN